MAALSSKSSPDKSHTIHSFRAQPLHPDYLLEEVIDRQPKHVQDFLLQTSILEQMNGSLCDAVTGIRGWEFDSEQFTSHPELPINGQQILEYLERSNLFLLSLDDERRWYRYHQLFAELLAVRLEHFYPHLVNRLHRRPSEWHEQNGLIPAPSGMHWRLNRLNMLLE
jgi:LuxR family maltose regulon positive regulatory protein